MPITKQANTVPTYVPPHFVMIKYAIRSRSPHSSNTALNTSPPSTIQTVVLVHEPNATSTGARPVTRYNVGNKIEAASFGINSNAIIKITNTVIIKNFLRSSVNIPCTGITPMISGRRIVTPQPMIVFLFVFFSIVSQSISKFFT